MKFQIAILVYSCLLVSPGESVGVATIAHIAGGFRALFATLKDMWEIVGSNVDGPMPFGYVDKYRTLMEKMHGLAERIDDLKETVRTEQLATVTKIIHHMTKRFKVELRMNDLVQHVHKVRLRYKRLLAYLKYKRGIKNSTWINFAENVVSHDFSSISSLLGAIHLLIVSDIDTHSTLLALMADKDLDITTLCIAKQSPNQLLYNFYNTIALTEMKGYAMIQFSYILLRQYGKGNYTEESEIEREHFIERTLTTAKEMQTAMKTASRELFRCDPEKQVEGETYLEITQLLQGYVENEVDLNSGGNCWSNCAGYEHTKSYSCYQNLFCWQQRKCRGKILNCKFVESHMQVCPSDDSTKRRYDYIEYKSGQVYGQRRSCPNKLLDVNSWWRWIFWHCSYCMCLCDEEGFYSDRYFSAQTSLADIKNNRVISGIKFTKDDRIIHLQIQQGRLLPGGIINKTTVEWVPVDKFRLDDRYVYKDKSYFTLSWTDRAIDLDVIEADDGYVLTGVRLRKRGTHLYLEIHVTAFDYATGLLNPSWNKWIANRNKMLWHSNREPIEVKDADVPTRFGRPTSIKSGRNQYLEFTHTSFEADAAQTTVPFLDSQPVTTNGIPNSGAGLHYKSSGPKDGGYIGITLVTFDYSDYLTKEGDLLDESQIN